MQLTEHLRPHPRICLTESTMENDRMSVLLTGQIDFESSHPLCRYLCEEVERLGPRTLELDFRAVTFVDSEGLAMLLTLQRNCQARSTELALLKPSVNVLKLIKLTRVDTLMPVLG